MLPDYFEPRPPLQVDARTREAIEQLFAEKIRHGNGQQLSYRLDVAKWEFLCQLVDSCEVVLHGSADADIDEFEPRKSADVDDFGNQRAVYAASDGIWPMFFAVVDRTKAASLVNAAFRLIESDGDRSDPYYYFSVDAAALERHPWRSGTVYVLPRADFRQQPVQRLRQHLVEHQQWASHLPVTPLARLAVDPSDFPFLSRVRPHDPARLQQAAAREPDGFPWLVEDLPTPD
jgi:hypothetical protein